MSSSPALMVMVDFGAALRLARQFGQAARQTGKPCAPNQDRQLLELRAPCSVVERCRITQAWLNGWYGH